MEIGKVIGNVWATKKDEGISGQKLLVVNIMKNRQQKKDSLLVAAEAISNLSKTPCLWTMCLNKNSAIGDLHMLPWQTNSTFIIFL